MSNGDPRYDFFYPSITLILFLVWVIWSALDVMVLIAYHARIQEFSSGGVQVSLTKKALTTFFFLFFFSPQLILQKSNGQFQRNLSFFKVPEGVNIFQGGVQLFPGGGGSNCLFPIETNITCDFPGGSGPPVPPPLWIRTCIQYNGHLQKNRK